MIQSKRIRSKRRSEISEAETYLQMALNCISHQSINQHQLSDPLRGGHCQHIEISNPSDVVCIESREKEKKDTMNAKSEHKKYYPES